MVDIEEVWRPIPGTSQELALDTRCHHTLYTGSRGPGKTDCQLMRFRRRVGMGYGAFWSGIIFDLENKNLEDVIAKSQKWFPKFDDGAHFHKGHAHQKWVWPTGEELKFRPARNMNDYWKFHGHEYPFIGWNELTKHPTPELYDAMMSVNRTSFRPEDHPIWIDGVIWDEHRIQVIVDRNHPNARKKLLPEIPLEVFSTCNPYGVGHHWVKARFITPAPYGEVVRRKVKVFDPRSQKDIEVELTQVAIFGSYKENIYLSPEYVATLSSQSDEAKREAWLHGSWDIIAGGALDDVWDRDVHILPRFVIPPGWRIDRTFDWGSTTPFSVGWWAIANGEEATIVKNGERYTFCPPAGTLIQIAEWYGSVEIGLNKGLRMSAKDIADGIRQREESLQLNEWISTKVYPGAADNQIRNITQSDEDTIEKKMADRGVKWTKSDKAPGSRKTGLQLIRDRLQASSEGEGPGLYFMDNCKASISILPVLPRCEKDPDDVSSEAEDHAYDMVRYRVLAAGRKPLITNVNVRYSS